MMAAEELRHNRSKDLLSGPLRGVDSNQSRWPRALLVDLVHRIDDFTHGGLDLRQELLAGGSERHAPRRPVEKPHSQPCFERRDCMAKSRRGDSQVASRSPETLAGRDRGRSIELREPR